MFSIDKLIYIGEFNTQLNTIIGTSFNSFSIYRSKGLLAHLIKQKHYVASKYIDYLPDIINDPDFAGVYKGTIEMVKVYKDNIFISIKLDEKNGYYYVATIFDVKKSKIDSYVRSNRLKIVSTLYQKQLDDNKK